MRKEKLLLASLLTTGIVFGAMSSAYAQSNGRGLDISARFGITRGGNNGRDMGRDFGRGNDRDHGRDQRGDRDQQARVEYTTEIEYIGQEVKAGEKVLLGKAFNLQRDHKGKEIETITVNIFGLRRGGEVTLLINGKKAGQIKEFEGRNQGEQKIKWTLPNRELVIGEDVKTLQLEFAGQAFVMEVELLLKEEIAPQRPEPRPMRPFVVDVQKDFYGQEIHSVAALISANYDQYKTEASQVALMIDGPSFRGKAQLCLASRPNQCGEQKIVSFDRRLLELEVPFGAEVGELMLKTAGQFSIKQIVVYPKR